MYKDEFPDDEDIEDIGLSIEKDDYELGSSESLGMN